MKQCRIVVAEKLKIDKNKDATIYDTRRITAAGSKGWDTYGAPA